MSEVAAIIAALAAALTSMAALIAALRANRKIEVLHVAVNSRLTELLEKTEAASLSQGRAEGQASERARTKAKKPAR